MKEMWFICTVEYYSAVKDNDFRKFEGKLIEPEKKIFLSEETQTEKDKCGNSHISGY